MSLKFTVLPVGRGDAYLIEELGDDLKKTDECRNYLFDAGSTNKICFLVPSKIAVAICSHNDQDHAGGFLHLLNNDDIEIEELWLPGTWLAILAFIKEWMRNNIPLRKLDPDKIIETINNLMDEERPEIKLTELIEQFDNEGHSTFEFDIPINEYSLRNLFDIYYAHTRFYPRLLYSSETRNVINNILFRVDRIVKIACLAYERDIKIRWFLPDTPKNSNSGAAIHPFNPLNSHEVLNIKARSIEAFFALAYLSKENKYSLVFEYLKSTHPVILFTADNDLSFLPKNKNLSYNNSIIITAPHHGSDSNALAYNKIRCKKSIWVRSSGPRISMGQSAFLHQPNRYCDYCSINQRQFKEIKFEWKNSMWICKCGLQCICPNVKTIPQIPVI